MKNSIDITLKIKLNPIDSGFLKSTLSPAIGRFEKMNDIFYCQNSGICWEYVNSKIQIDFTNYIFSKKEDLQARVIRLKLALILYAKENKKSDIEVVRIKNLSSNNTFRYFRYILNINRIKAGLKPDYKIAI